MAPKAIGESKIIKLSELKKNNYLKDNILNEKGESCMDNSFIRVYKSSQNEYTYTTYLYCGNEEVPDTIELPLPSIELNFSKYNEVSNPYFTYKIDGSKDDDTLTIDGYEFSISTKLNENEAGGETTYNEVYNSGTINGNRHTTITNTIKFKDYVDISGVSSVKVDFIVYNSAGGVAELSESTSNSGEENTPKDYKDDIKPICGEAKNVPSSENDWYNKNSPQITRTISVPCTDPNNGSGCIRSNFAKTWPNDSAIFGAEYAYIEIKDNANNAENCRVMVNVDILSPRVVVTAKGNDQTLKTISAGGANSSNVPYADSAVLNYNDYTNVPKGTDGNYWFNSTFADGVSYEVQITDNLHIDHWTWEVNKYNISYSEYVKNNAVVRTGLSRDGAKGSYAKDSSGDHGSTSEKITVGFKGEGVRYGKLTVYDKAGNKSTIEIYALIDRTPPAIPSSIVTKELESRNESAKEAGDYTPKVWTNKYVKAYISETLKVDSISVFDKVSYEAYKHGATSATKTGNTSFVFTSDYQGVNKIRFKACDKALNCSGYSAFVEVWLDTINPTCVTKTDANDLANKNEAGWWKIGQTARVYAECSDQGSGSTGSGCVQDNTMQTIYNDNFNVTNAGAKGVGNGGSFKDVAGNSVNCSANQTIKMDHIAPTCTVSKQITSGSTESSSGWLGKGESVTVKAHCTDPQDSKNRVASGCATADFSNLYNTNINTTKAGAVGDNNGGSVSDVAGNIVNCSANQTVKIDTNPPTCTVSKKLTSGSTESESGWLGKGESVTVIGTCTDTGGSGCVGNISKLYNTNINTTKAGAVGDNNGGSVRDNADNTANCSANQTVKIDINPPTCVVSGDSTTYTSSNRTISYKCSDTGGSGCNTSFSGGSKEFNTTTKQGKVGPYSIKDNADNSYSCAEKTVNVYVDKTPPSVPKITTQIWTSNTGATPTNTSTANRGTSYTSGSWTNRYVYSVPSDSKDDDSGFSYYQYSFSGATSVGYTTASYNNVTTQGTTTISWRACDKVGNCSSAATKSALIDTTAPSVSAFFFNNVFGFWFKYIRFWKLIYSILCSKRLCWKYNKR